MEATDFPQPTGLLRSPSELDPEFDQQNMRWDYLINRTVRLVRQALSHRQGPMMHSAIPESLFEEQQRVLGCLNTWHRHYEMQSLDPALTDEESESRLHHRMECIIGQIWAACCLTSSEMRYDEHTARFEELVGLSQQLVGPRTASGGPAAPPPKFIFELGFMPYLYFVVLNCRRLDLRIRALQHILLATCDRENLFDGNVLYSVGVRIIRVEHGIQLDPSSWPEYPDQASAAAAPLPPDHLRIRSANVTDETETRRDETGKVSLYRKVYFVVQPEAIVTGYEEWVKILSPPRTLPIRMNMMGTTATAAALGPDGNLDQSLL